MKRLLAILLALAPVPALAAAHIITVTGTVLRPDGTIPTHGSVTWQLSQTLYDATTGKTYYTTPKNVPLDSAGHFSVSLVASDDPELNPTGGTYRYTKHLDNLPDETTKVVVPYAVSTVDAAALVPASFSGPQASDFVTKATEQTITGRKTFAITGENTTPIFSAAAYNNPILLFKRYNETGAPLLPGYEVGGYINSQGGYVTNAGILSSGQLDSVTGVTKWPADIWMFGCYGDVFGPCYLARPLGIDGSSSSFEAMTHGTSQLDQHFVWRIDDLGKMWFGDSATEGGEDTSIYRTGVRALRTNAAWTFDGFVESASTVAGSGFAINGVTAPPPGGMALDIGGELRWGGGTQLDDVSFYRSGASTLTLSNGGAGVGNLVVGNVMASGPVQAQAVVSTTPSIATACSSSARGSMVYVDDSNDTAVSHMCFCGTGADDSTYAWRQVNAPATTCP